MKRFALCFVPLLALLASAVARANLAGDINNVLHDKLLNHATESIEIDRLSGNRAQLLYQHDAGSPKIPASNLKVATTSAALNRLGPNFKFRTRLVFHNGDLILIGDGDPSFGDAELLSRYGWDANTVFRNWAADLVKLKLKTVRDVIVDDSIFETTMRMPHWPANQILDRYEPEVAGMNLNANCLDVYVKTTRYGQRVNYVLDPPTHYVNFTNSCVTGSKNSVWLSRAVGTNDVSLRGQCKTSNKVPVSITIHDPPMFAGTVLAETLKAGGINVTGNVHRDRTIADQMKKMPAGDHSFVTLAIHETPIQQVMARANKDSMNLYAECLCKRLGAAETGQSGSWQNGPAAVGTFLLKIGVPSSQFHLDDGCGMSKLNNISAHALVKVLAYDRTGPNAKLFRSTLAVAGIDGTLRERFRGSNIRGRLFGKSGFVDGVSTLCGYLHARDGQWFIFSIMFNGIPPGTNSGAKILQERIIRSLDSTPVLASMER